MASHTPGPWEVVNGFMHFPEITANGVKIATPAMLGETIGTLKNSGKAPEILANARLIAHAPELLAALEGLVARQGNESIGVKPWSEVWAHARAAIHAARGE